MKSLSQASLAGIVCPDEVTSRIIVLKSISLGRRAVKIYAKLIVCYAVIAQPWLVIAVDYQNDRFIHSFSSGFELAQPSIVSLYRAEIVVYDIVAVLGNVAVPNRIAPVEPVGVVRAVPLIGHIK